MSLKTKGLLPKIENLIIIVFLLSFVMWAFAKCEARRDVLNQVKKTFDPDAADTENTTANIDTIYKVDSSSIALPNSPTLNAPQQPSTSTATVTSNNYQTLYVTIDQLNFRKTPDLSGELISKLPLFEEVSYLNEFTDSIYTINLGTEFASEPWIKIKTQRGFVGWVFGAGVDFKKQKRKGVL